VGKDGRVALWNQKIAGLTGLTAAGVRGKLFLDLVSPESASAAAEAVERTRRRPRRRASYPPVKYCRINMNVTALCDQDLVCGGVVEIGQDLSKITYFKEMELNKSRFVAVVSRELRSPLHGEIG
jgi:transcriptional regulator with PAS, ATPase and Fis domain